MTRRGWLRLGQGTLAVALAALLGLLAATTLRAQTQGANGVLTYHHRAFSGEASDAIYGIGPIPSSLPASPVKMVNGYVQAAWAPDGNSALLWDRSALWLWKVGSDPVQVEGAYAEAPTWSPDGTRFAFAEFEPGNNASAQIYVANADGSNPHQIPICGAKIGLAWGNTPHGQKIAVAGFSCAALEWEIYTMDPDGLNLSKVAGVSSELVFGPPSLSGLDWSPDGSGKLLFSASDGNVTEHGDNEAFGNLFVVDTGTGVLTKLTNDHTWEGPHASTPVWSPDGKQIAYAASERSFDGQSVHAGSSRIWVMNADGSNQRAVSAPLVGEGLYDNYDELPAWQPCVATTLRCTAAAFATSGGTTTSTTTTTPGTTTTTTTHATTTTTTSPTHATTTTPTAACRTGKRTLIVDGPNASAYPINTDSCWNEVVHFGGRSGCNGGRPDRYWGWNEIQSPRGGSPRSQVLACAGDHPGANGVLFYAGDASLTTPWSVSWKVPSATHTKWRLLELYGCQRGEPGCAADNHEDVVTLKPRNLLHLWARGRNGSFGAIINIGGTNMDNSEIHTEVLAACRASTLRVFGIYWGGGEKANLTARRRNEVANALNTCLPER